MLAVGTICHWPRRPFILFHCLSLFVYHVLLQSHRSSVGLSVLHLCPSRPTGGYKPDWIRTALARLARELPQIQTVDWFLYNKNGAMWDLNSHDERATFINGYWDACHARS